MSRDLLHADFEMNFLFSMITIIIVLTLIIILLLMTISMINHKFHLVKTIRFRMFKSNKIIAKKYSNFKLKKTRIKMTSIKILLTK